MKGPCPTQAVLSFFYNFQSYFILSYSYTSYIVSVIESEFHLEIPNSHITTQRFPFILCAKGTNSSGSFSVEPVNNGDHTCCCK